MKHSNIYQLYQALKQCEIQELKRALNAHGGSYTWTDKDDCPIVTYNPESPFDIRIEKIWKDKYSIYFDGQHIDTGDSYKKCCIEDVEYSHIDFILSEIPETEEISDVSSDIDFTELTTTLTPTTSVNKVFLCGRVGSLHIDEDAKLIKFTLCTTRCYKSETNESILETSWHNLEAFESDDVNFDDIKTNNVLYIKGCLKYDRYINSNGNESIQAKIHATNVTKILTPLSYEHNNRED